jgi:hypothetical protein
VSSQLGERIRYGYPQHVSHDPHQKRTGEVNTKYFEQCCCTSRSSGHECEVYKNPACASDLKRRTVEASIDVGLHNRDGVVSFETDYPVVAHVYVAEDVTSGIACRLASCDAFVAIDVAYQADRLLLPAQECFQLLGDNLIQHRRFRIARPEIEHVPKTLVLITSDGQQQVVPVAGLLSPCD